VDEALGVAKAGDEGEEEDEEDDFEVGHQLYFMSRLKFTDQVLTASRQTN
jgi:hypothetical protein